jgi:DNA-binding NarL/FixJ family response regulator
MVKIRILITDDHSIVREGIKSMLKNFDDFEIVGEAENGKEAIEKIGQLFPDVIIMDISMPVMTGIEAIKIIKSDYSNVKTLVLTIHSEKEYIEQIYRSGATGCLYKSAGKNEFETAIRSIHKGESYFTSDISNALLKEHFHSFNKENPLTQRELQILKLIVEELSNQEIANTLFISIRTVETHRKNIMQKLNIDSTIGLIKYAVKKGMISTQ